MAMLILCTIIYTVHFVWYHGGYFGFDDVEYCRLADSLVRGDYEYLSLYAHRFAVVVPLSLLYGIFGVSDLANYLLGLGTLLGIIYFAISFIKETHDYQKWAAFLFLILSPLHLMYVEKPMPDIIVELGFLVSYMSYFSTRFKLQGNGLGYKGFVVGVILMFLAKETFLIFYPFFVGVMIMDIYHKRNLDFWKSSIIVLSAFILLYLVGYVMLLGDPLARIHHIFDGQYVSACSYDLQPMSVLMERISYQLWRELSRNLFLIPLCFLPVLLSVGDAKQKFVLQSFIVLLLLANFMTISYTSYVPLCPDPRHHMYLLPIGAWVLAYGIGHIHHSSVCRLFWMVLLLVISLATNVLLDFEYTWWVYVPIIFGLVASYKGHHALMVGLMLVGFGSVGIKNGIYNKKVNYAEQKLLNDYVIKEIPGFKYVITDRVNQDYGWLHSQFDTMAVRFVDYKSLDTFRFSPNVSRYIIVNGMSSYLSNTPWESLPEYVRTAHEKLPKVYENKSGVVYKWQ